MKTNNNRYSLLVEWSTEDDTWIGRCPELMLGGVHGQDRAQVYQELCQAVDEHLALSAREDLPLPKPLAERTFSGKFIVRISPDHHRLLALRALKEGDSLNNYVARQLK